MKKLALLSLLAVAGALPASALAAEKPVKAAADVATAETLPESGLPSEWIQGDALKKFDKGTVYVFEFWATWCGPCIQAMPHMEELHKGIKDPKKVRIVGICVMDNAPADKITAILKSKGVTYAIARDGRGGPAATRWLNPLDVRGIPHAIAVKDGKILWQGHPMGLNADMLKQWSKPGFKPAKPAAKNKGK